MRFEGLSWLILPALLAGCAMPFRDGAGPERIGPEVYFERSIYFASPEGARVELPAGRYSVERGEGESLLVSSEDGLVRSLAAQEGSHDEELGSQTLVFVPEPEGGPALLLLLPNGQSLSAVGSHSEVVERGWDPRAPARSQLITSPAVRQRIQRLPASTATRYLPRVTAVSPAPATVGAGAAPVRLEFQGERLEFLTQVLVVGADGKTVPGVSASLTHAQAGATRRDLRLAAGADARPGSYRLRAQAFRYAVALPADAQVHVPFDCRTPDRCEPTDADGDGIPDAWENRLAARYAPELRLPSYSDDDIRPVNVRWYLQKTEMWFDHSGCGDDSVATSLDPATVHHRSHRMKDNLCRHKRDTRLSSDSKNNHFYLKHKWGTVRKGIPADRKDLWIAYVHVRPCRMWRYQTQTLDTPGGKMEVKVPIGTEPCGNHRAYDIQYWFLYPYDDLADPLNHEGDWEHVTVTADETGAFHSAYYSQHEGGKVYFRHQLDWVDGSAPDWDVQTVVIPGGLGEQKMYCRKPQTGEATHPVVYVAARSHANYAQPGSYNVALPGVSDDLDELGIVDHAYSGDDCADGMQWGKKGPVWETWKSWTNVGEVDHPRQNFLLYRGRWGRVGTSGKTSGPRGPSTKDDWKAWPS